MCLQILTELISKGGTVKQLIEEKDLVQVNLFTFWQEFKELNSLPGK